MKHTYYFVVPALFVLLGACETPTNKETMNQKHIPGLDLSYLNPQVAPGVNFYEFATGGWTAAHPIPDEYSQYGAFTAIYEDNQEALKSIVEKVSASQDAPEGSTRQKIRDFFNSGMDTAKLEVVNIKPLQPYFEAIDNISSPKEIMDMVARMQRKGINPMFYFFSSADPRNSDYEIANLYQGGLGLPDVDYYTSDDERSVEIRDAYLIHLEKMFILIGYDQVQAAGAASAVMQIETELAKASMSRLERRDPEKTYNKMYVSELEVMAPEIDWKAYFRSLGWNEPTEINVRMTDFIKKLAVLSQNIPLDDWKTYLKWNVLNETANYLNKAIVEQNFAFYGQTLSGSKTLQDRWKRVMNVVSSGMGEALGQLYVADYFPPEAKNRMLELVGNLKSAMSVRINQLDWMEPETKQKALQKLESMRVKVGYPDKWIDYSNLEIIPGEYFNNVLAAKEFEFQRNLDKIGKKVDEDEWGMTPQTVNAYYSPTHNEIVFPAGILQPPFFNQHADDPINYGAIGVVIGHEMTHGFDDQGRKYDANGNLNDWWTENDARQFEEKTAVLVEQYNNYPILDSLRVDGKLTLGENIADLGGLNIAYDALQKALEGENFEPMDGFNADQRFFLGYAQLWRQNIRDKELMRRLKEDVHSPGDARVNVPITNMEQFYKAFKISSDDPIYRSSDDRAVIW